KPPSLMGLDRGNHSTIALQIPWLRPKLDLNNQIVTGLGGHEIRHISLQRKWNIFFLWSSGNRVTFDLKPIGKLGNGLLVCRKCIIHNCLLSSLERSTRT